MQKIKAATVALALAVAACGGSESEPAAVLVPDAEPSGSSSTAPALEPAATDPVLTDAPITDPPATDPPVTDAPVTDVLAPPARVQIVSGDGSLAVEVGAADAARVNPSIRILDPADWPAELVSGDNLPGVTIYELEPDGATFDEPVTVTRRVDVSAFGDDIGPLSVPIVTLMTQSDSGDYSLLQDLALTRSGPALFASASTTHFSPIVTVNNGATVEFEGAVSTAGGIQLNDALSISGFLDMSLAQVEEGAEDIDWDDIDVDVLESLSEIDDVTAPFSVDYFRGDEFVEFDEFGLAPVAQTTIARSDEEISKVLLELFTEVDELPADNPLLAEGVPVTLQARIGVLLVGASGDGATVEEEELAIQLADETGFELVVVHTPLGPFPSYTRKVVTGLPAIAADHTLYSVVYTGKFGVDGQFVDYAEMNADGDGYAAETGLASYGAVREALLLVTGEVPPGLRNGTASDFWQFVANDARVELAVTITDIATGEVQEFEVTAAEGELFNGPVGLMPFPAP